MKLVLFIIGLVVLGLGAWLTGETWYSAAFQSHFSEASAYAGPVLIILGLLRIARAAMPVQLPSFFRIAVVLLAIGTGYGNSALIKMVYPNAVHDRPAATATNP
jgi:xanthine/uracil permease